MNENDAWVCVYKANQLYDAEMMKIRLEHNDLPCVIVNKQDSSYLAFGSIEVHVPEQHKIKALALIAGQGPLEESNPS